MRRPVTDRRALVPRQASPLTPLWGMILRRGYLIAFLLSSTLVACASDLVAPTSCADIQLAPIAPLTIRVSDTAVTVYDTLTLAPSITFTDAESRAPIMLRSTGAHAEPQPVTLRIFNSKLPATVIPVQFFVRGRSPGTDTIIVTTRITGPQCASGAVQRIPVTVIP